LKELEASVAEKSLYSADQTLSLDPFQLHYEDSLPGARIAFRLAGNEKGPVVAVLGGISAHRVVLGQSEGWWPEMVGPGLGVDTRLYRVLGIDYLGGRGESSTPAVSRPSVPMIRPKH
jgi:homoserine O-acetyltransferase/O-succinyltransferase